MTSLFLAHGQALSYHSLMPGLFHGTPLERPVTCEVCEKPLDDCTCPRDAAGKVKPPGDQQATIRLEKRGKGKVVTTITGLDPVASDLPAILRILKANCGAGGTVAGDVIEIQGDHRENVATQLKSMQYTSRIA